MHDWKAKELRIAAVEYAMQECGEVVRADVAYLARVERTAAALEIPGGGAVLVEWLRDRSLRPSWDKGERHEAPRGRDARRGFLEVEFETAEMAGDALTAKVMGLPEMAAGGVPGLSVDPLSVLLAEEDGVLSEGEREEMAARLEDGLPLTRGQRLALAVQLRGSSLSGRRELVRAVLDYIAPEAGATERQWTVRSRQLVLHGTEDWTVRPIGTPLAGMHRGCQLVGSMLIFRDGTGEAFRVVPYARVCLTRPTPQGGRAVRYRQLVPGEKFARDLALRQFAVLASMVRNDGRTAKGWAQLFGETKAATSYTRKRLDERIRQDSGSAVGFRGLRAKPDPRKGTRKGGGS